MGDPHGAEVARQRRRDCGADDDERRAGTHAGGDDAHELDDGADAPERTVTGTGR